MKRKSCVLFALMLVVMVSGCNTGVRGSGEVEMKNSVDSLSYAMGYLEAQQFKQMLSQTAFDSLDNKAAARLFSDAALSEQYLEFRKNQFGDFNPDMFRAAFINELAFGKSYFDEMSADLALRTSFEREQARKAEEQKALFADNIAKGEAFLAENAKRPEVTVLESGLQYEVITEGNGPRPTAADRVKCHYHGTLIDGTVFDSSVERGEPATFGLNQVIPGWTEGVQLMPVGSKWKFFIPSALAYGERGAGEAVAPNSALIFEIELIDIE